MARQSSRLNLINDSAMVAGAMKLYNAIRKFAPYKRIKDSVFISRIEGKGTSRFISVGINTNPETGAPFARAFDTGSGIHATKGKRGRYLIPGRLNPNPPPFLQFMGTNDFAGRVIRVKEVKHPGVRGIGYTKKAIDDAKPSIRKEIAKDVKENLRLYLRAEFERFGK
jgi:hypothetical protein